VWSFILLVGCRDPVSWSAECRSTDGGWTAIAETVVHEGFGTGGVETTVDIKSSTGSRSRERVLAFADGGADIGLKMRWDGPSHLVVTYRGSPELLYFQVVKTSGIDISVENASPNPALEFHPSAKP
jgi:hypothetical protein